jgi:hypothetical protein
MAKEKIVCFYKRPAGKRSDLVILEVKAPHEHAGETVVCNCFNQEWITKLTYGTEVLIWGPPKQGSQGDLLADACADILQPHLASGAAVINAIEELEAENSKYYEERRVSTKLKGRENINAFLALASQCPNGHQEAGHLLIGYARLILNELHYTDPTTMYHHIQNKLTEAGQPTYS